MTLHDTEGSRCHKTMCYNKDPQFSLFLTQSYVLNAMPNEIIVLKTE